MPAFKKLPVAAFNGSEVYPRVERVRTLGDLLDYAQAVYITCDCDRRIVEIGPERFLMMKPTPSEDTPIRELALYLRCRKCGEKGTCTVKPTGRWRPGMVPRVKALPEGMVRQMHGAFPWGAPPSLPGTPRDDGPEGPKGRKRRFRAR